MKRFIVLFTLLVCQYIPSFSQNRVYDSYHWNTSPSFNPNKTTTYQTACYNDRPHNILNHTANPYHKIFSNFETHTDTASSNMRFSLQFNTEFTSYYIWRDNVYAYPAIQPDITLRLEHTGFSINLWQSVGAANETFYHQTSTSINYELPISKTIESSLGIIYYFEPSIEDSVHYSLGELTSSWYFSVLLSPYITFAFDENTAFYSMIGLSQSLYKNHWLALLTRGGIDFGLAQTKSFFRKANLEVAGQFSCVNAFISVFVKGSYIPHNSGEHQKDFYPESGIRFTL